MPEPSISELMRSLADTRVLIAEMVRRDVYAIKEDNRDKQLEDLRKDFEKMELRLEAGEKEKRARAWTFVIGISIPIVMTLINLYLSSKGIQR